MGNAVKQLAWVGSARRDLRTFPDEVKRAIGYALFEAQQGRKSPSAKPLSGFGGTAVLEILEDFRANTYRAVLYCQI